MPKDFAPLINGVQYSFSSVRVNILGVSLAGLRGIEYGMKQAMENIYGTGTEVNSRSYGKREFSASLNILFSDYLALENAAPNKDITQIPPFSIVVAYIEGANVVTYSLENCQFPEYKHSMKNGDMSIEVQLPLILTGIVRKR